MSRSAAKQFSLQMAFTEPRMSASSFSEGFTFAGYNQNKRIKSNEKKSSGTSVGKII
jgi:hypothetical protein